MNQKEPSITFLNDIYRNTSSGIEAIVTLLPKTQDDMLSKDLQNQLHRLRSIEANTVRKIKQLGKAPKEPSLMQRLGMKMGIHMNTLLDKSSSHLAELMIKGNNMGIIDLNRSLNRFSATNSGAAEIAEELLSTEQQALNMFKGYL